jgi:hypothetical protein
LSTGKSTIKYFCATFQTAAQRRNFRRKSSKNRDLLQDNMASADSKIEQFKKKRGCGHFEHNFKTKFYQLRTNSQHFAGTQYAKLNSENVAVRPINGYRKTCRRKPQNSAETAIILLKKVTTVFW